MATQRMKTDARYLPKNIERIYGAMKNFGGYSIAIAQLDAEKKIPNLPSAYWSAALTCLTSAVFLLLG